MNDMLRTVIVGFISGILGAAVTLAVTADNEPERAAQLMPGMADTDALLERIAELEGRLDEDDSTSEEILTSAPGEQQEEAQEARPQFLSFESRAARRAEIQQQQQTRVETYLLNAGWTDDEIAAVEQAQLQAALDLEQQNYEQLRRQFEENPDAAAPWRGSRHVLRDTLGDQKYEQYLEATGRPAAVEVHDVLAGSAGAAAGLQPGDRIRSYGSERIFDEGDLWMAIVSGTPGESVTIEVERDGAIFHVTVPVGPLGTSNMVRAFLGRP